MISVIIPFYNSEQTLKKCLDSVFSNKFEKFEVIAVSDCSEDNSLSIAKNYTLFFKKIYSISSIKKTGIINIQKEIYNLSKI